MGDKNMNYVRFDVGHHLFVTHKNTIEKYRDCVLAKYIKPEFDKRHSPDDYIVIDRDGRHFGDILNFMRDPKSLHLDDWSTNDLADLMREADFYCLNEMTEICDTELVARKQRDEQREKELKEREKTINPLDPVPPHERLEIIFGFEALKLLLDYVTKPTLLLSYVSMKKFHIDSWFIELRRLCNFNKFNVYCFAEVVPTSVAPDTRLRNFLISLYDPEESKFTQFVLAPEYERFKAKRPHYKYKIFKAWFCIQNGYFI